MINDYQKEIKNNSKKSSKTKSILIAPSWQKDNICDLCLEEVIDVKGKLTESFKIKRKMLLYKYRDIDFKCLQEKGRKPNKYWVQIL